MLYATTALAGSTAIAPGCCGHQDKPASQCAHASSEENIFGARLISSTLRRPRFAIPLARVAAELARTPRTLAPLLAVFSRTCRGAHCARDRKAALLETSASPLNSAAASRSQLFTL